MTSYLQLIILSPLSNRNPFLFRDLPQRLIREIWAIFDEGDSQVVDLIDFFKRTHKRLLQALVLLDWGGLDFEVALEDEGGLVVVSDDLGGSVVLLAQVVGVGLADFFLEPAEVVAPEGHGSRVFVEAELVAKWTNKYSRTALALPVLGTLMAMSQI